MQKLAAGNWKMNGLAAALAEVQALIAAHPAPACEMLLCPPATLIAQMAWAAKGTTLPLGGQDCHPKASGAHTGDISAAMLKDAGRDPCDPRPFRTPRRSWRNRCPGARQGRGGSGRRPDRRSSASAKPRPSVTRARRWQVIGAQLDGSVPDGATAATLVVAYEPVWAIGTGRTPTIAQIAEVHAFLRARLTARIGAEAPGVRILYGGSVKPSNADRDLCRAACRRRAGRRGQPEGRRFRRHRRSAFRRLTTLPRRGQTSAAA